MIGALRGKIEVLEPGTAIIWVNDVGYLLNLPANLSLTDGQSQKVYVHTYVREDALSLYAFLSREELKLFQAFIQISGIGPRLALAILETYKTDDIKIAIRNSDVSFFTRVSGIGKKGAQKIILELSSVLKLDVKEEKKYNPKLIQALKSLGYKSNEFRPILDRLQLKPDLEISQALKLVLKELARSENVNQ